MIVVSVNRSNGRIEGYTVKGHARYRPRGEDILCAAVSMLAQTTLLGLGRFIEKGLNYALDNESGKLNCSIPAVLEEKVDLQSQAILETMVIGLLNLQKSYPNYIRVFRRRWTS